MSGFPRSPGFSGVSDGSSTAEVDLQRLALASTHSRIKLLL